MKNLLILIISLFFFSHTFGQGSYNVIPGKNEFTDTMKLRKLKNNAGLNYILSTDTAGRIIKVINPNGTPFCVTTLLSGSVVWISGFNFQNTKLTYQIGCQLDTASASSFSITESDTLDRYTIIWADTLGNIGTTDGTTGEVASIPNVNPLSQILLATYFIPANSTQPIDLNAVSVYKENTVPPEWAGITSVVGGSFIWPTNPYQGLYSTYIPSFVTGDYVYYYDGSDHDLNDYTFLYFYIRLGTAFTNSNFIVLYFRDASGGIGYVYLPSGQYGLNGAITGSYQLVAIPKSAIVSLRPATTFQAIEFQFQGTGGAVQLDNVILQEGGGNESNSGVIKYNGQAGNVTSTTIINADSTYEVHIVNGVRTDSTKILKSHLFDSTGIEIVQIGIDSFAILATGGGSGSGISELGNGYGLLNVNDSTYDVDSSIIATRARLINELALKENSLGNPLVNGYVLSSTTGGVRSWVAQTGGGGGIDSVRRKAGTDTIYQYSGATPSFAFRTDYSVNIQDYGAIGDMKSGTDGAISSGTPTFTSASIGFSLLDIGKTIRVTGAGAAGVDLLTTISGYTNATTVTLANNASSTVSSKAFDYGTDNTAAIQAAADAVPITGAIVRVPIGWYLINGGIFFDNPVRILGDMSGRGEYYIVDSSLNNYHPHSGFFEMAANQSAAVTLQASGSIWEGVDLFSNSGNTITSGIGLNINAGNVSMYNSFFWGFWNSVQQNYSTEWRADHCLFAAINAGLYIQNLFNGDHGDYSIIDCYFAGSNPLSKMKSAIKVVSSGGMKLMSNKFNSNFEKGVDVNLVAALNTSDFQISNNSFENYDSTAMSFISSGASSLRNILINGNQVAPYTSHTTAININGTGSTELSGVNINGNVLFIGTIEGGDTAIKIIAATQVDTYPNTIYGNWLREVYVSPTSEINPLAAMRLYGDTAHIGYALGVGVQYPTSVGDFRQDQNTVSVATTTAIQLTNAHTSGLAALAFSSDGTQANRKAVVQYNNTTGSQNLFITTLDAYPTYIGANSGIGISLSTANAVRFNTYTAGTAVFDGSGNITSSSDRRIKHAINDFKYGLVAIMKIRPRTFIYNADSSNTVMSGFIAQEVESVIPTAVHKANDKRGTLSLETNAILGAAVNAIQELNVIIEDLKKSNLLQQKKMDEMEKQIKILLLKK